MPHAIVALLVLLATQATRCGPDDSEAASAVFLSAPVFLAVGYGLLQLLRWLWRPVRPVERFGVGPGLAAMVVCLLLGVTGIFLSLTRYAQPDGTTTSEIDLSLVTMALLIVGPSYLTLLLLTWRCWFWRAAARSFTWSFLPPLLLLGLPGLVMLLGRTEDWLDPVLYLWGGPGFWGAPTFVVLVGLIVEVVVRRRRASAGAAPPVSPG